MSTLKAITLFVLGTCIAVPALQGQAGPTPVPAAGSRIDDFVIANHILANEDVLDGLGHLSARDEKRRDRFLLSRTIAPAVVTAADVMEFDLEGNPIDQQGRTMFSERFIHAAIFKARPDVMAIVHSHTPSVLPFANSDVPMRPMYQMSAFLSAGAPVFEIRDTPGEGMLVVDMRLGQALAQTLGNRTVALMRGHGAVVVGQSLQAAVSNAVHLDLNAKMQTQAAALGGEVKYLSVEEAKSFGDRFPADRVWQHLKARLEATHR